ncbi:LysM domain-containing protein [Streptomyces sp. T1317-0309]|nr:LysM domain-containing protein [Streptomyces sp. T1317-0309]
MAGPRRGQQDLQPLHPRARPGPEPVLVRRRLRLVRRASSTTYTVQPGDTLYRIARTYQVPGGWEALAEANDIWSPAISRSVRS